MGSQFWPNTCYTLKSILYTLEECVFYCCWMDYYAYVISILAVLLFKSSVSFLIFCFDDKSILGKGILKSPTVTVLLSVCPFSSVNIWFIYYCFCSVIMSCPNHWDPIDCSMPGFTVLHHLPEFAQIHVHWGDVIQPFHMSRKGLLIL